VSSKMGVSISPDWGYRCFGTVFRIREKSTNTHKAKGRIWVDIGTHCRLPGSSRPM
jgi:hypothetical protein